MKKYIPAVLFVAALVVIYNVVEARTVKVELPTAAEYVATQNEAFAPFNIIEAALQQTNMASLLAEKGPNTFFIPTDRAFMRYFDLDDSNEGADQSEAAIIALLSEMDVVELESLLSYHVISGNRGAKTIAGAQQFTALNGEKISSESLMSAGVVASVAVDNGYIHVTDQVLVP